MSLLEFYLWTVLASFVMLFSTAVIAATVLREDITLGDLAVTVAVPWVPIVGVLVGLIYVTVYFPAMFNHWNNVVIIHGKREPAPEGESEHNVRR